jgi:hypothetical protein
MSDDDQFAISKSARKSIYNRLVQERDEALAREKELQPRLYAMFNAGHACGFANAIEKATAVCDQCPDSHWGPWIKKRILALREKP